MREYGWRPGERHAVAILAVDPDNDGPTVADPSYGRERWPGPHLEPLWDGYALVLVPR
jgi:hypothetical protein